MADLVIADAYVSIPTDHIMITSIGSTQQVVVHSSYSRVDFGDKSLQLDLFFWVVHVQLVLLLMLVVFVLIVLPSH